MLARCRKFLALITLPAALVHSSQLLALGLGDLTVSSSLNEPLEATIELLGLDSLTSGQIQARLGNADEFERANIKRDFLIDNIQIEIIIFSKDQGILRLTSEEPVIEPFLSMVVNVGWPTGRLMRDYTALIDLPVFVSDEPQVVPLDVPQTPAPVREEPPARTPEPEPQTGIISSAEPVAPTVEDTPEPAPAEPSQDVVAQADEQDELEPQAEPETEAVAEQEQNAGDLVVSDEAEPEADTDVAEIAEEVTEDVTEDVADFEEVAEPEEPAEVTIESGDTLYDIAARNRPATSVSVEQTMLAIQRANPDAFINNNINMIRVGQVLRIPSIQEVQSIDQAQALNQIALQNQAVSVQPLAFSANNPDTSAQGSDELTILSGEDGSDSLSGDNDMAETIAALENQLAISEENLDRARLENAELTARFNELSEQIDILQNIIAMQDERLAQLQADLAVRNAEAAQAAAAQPIVDTPAQPPQADTSLMGKLSSIFENTLVLVSSLVALILMVVGFLVWRRQAAQDAMDDFDIDETAMAGDVPVTVDMDEPEGASAGFLAALKARMSRNNADHESVALVAQDEEEAELSLDAALTDEKGDDTDVTETDFEPAGLADTEVSEAADDHQDDLNQDDEDDEEESTGLLGKLKALFRRSSDDDETEDDDDSDLAYDPEDMDDDSDDDDLDDDPDDSDDYEDDDDENDDEESSYVEDDDEDEFGDLDDFDDLDSEHEDDEDLLESEDSSEELVAESADALLDKFLDEADLDESDAVEEDAAGEYDKTYPEAALQPETQEDLEQDTPSDDEENFAISDFDSPNELDLEDEDDSEAEIPADLSTKLKDDASPQTSNVVSLVEDMADSDVEDGSEADDDAFDFGSFTLDDNDKSETEPQASETSLGNEKSEKSEESEEHAEVTLPEEASAETEEDSTDLEFALDTALDTTLDKRRPESLGDASDMAEAEEDVETFDFSLDDKSPGDTNTNDANNDAEEDNPDLESFDFNLVDTAPGTESDDDNVKSEPDDVETFDFDVSSISSFEESRKPDVSDADAPILNEEVKDDLETFDFDLGELASKDEQDAVTLDDDDIVIEDHESGGNSLESLAAALGQVDAEASEEDSDVSLANDNEFDLDEINLDDSLFEIDDEDDAQETGDEPISDRDEASTKLDLAVAYEAMGDLDGAKEILNEVVAEGNAEQIAEATKLLQKWSDS